MKTPRWEDQWPGRFQLELDELRAAGISFTVDDALLKHRILRIDFVCEVDGTDVRGFALYPELFPDFRPAVQAIPLGLTHHQNPLGGNLCLLGRGGDRWRPSYTLAWLLTHQLRLVLVSGAPGAPSESLELEDAQAEPYSGYVPFEPGTAILVDGDWDLPANAEWGRLVIGTRGGELAGALQAAVIEIKDDNGKCIAAADPAIANLYPRRHHARWGRSALLKPDDLRAVTEEAAGRIPDAAKRSWPFVQCHDGKVHLLGIVIPEEVGHRSSGQGWIFAVQREESVGKKKRGRKPSKSRSYFARPVYSGRADLAARIPELEPFRQASIAVFGLGSLGAPAVLELARAGVAELRILDGDFVDAGPTVRWPFGVKDVGRAKAAVLHDFIREHYPYTRVIAFDYELGEPARLGRKADQHVLDEILNGVDLIFDATANLNVQRMLAELGRDRKIPYLMVEARHGGWGGIVFRQKPEVGTACLYCLQHALQPDSEYQISDAPAATPDGVQPRGCGDVTFTGTGFDMTTIALDAVRRAIGALCGGKYPDPPGNVAVISLRKEDGSPSAPTWQTHDMPRHPECDCSDSAA